MGEFHINTMLVVGGRWPIQPTSPHTCSQVQQDGLTRALHHKHQLLVLKACIVGLYQPPMRQGMLRVLMPSSCVGEGGVKCIFEDCQ